MNIKSISVFLRTTITFCLLLLIGVNQEALSGQEGHGGETVDIEGRPVLRDLVDNTVCDWVKADEFVSRITLFPEVLQSIEKVHWYLAFVIEREVPKLIACVTKGELKKIPSEDRDGLTIIEMDTKQVAIRINQMIFIDETLFEKLDEESKAFLFLHEVAHSFLPLETPRRNGKLRSFISTIQRHRESLDAMSQKHFALQMEMNSVGVTPTTEPFDDQKENILKAIDSQANDVERMAAAYKAYSKSNYLLSAHQKTIAQFKEKQVARYKNAVIQGKLHEIWEEMLLIGVDVNEFIKRPTSCTEYDDRSNDLINPLIVAVEKGDLDTIIKLSQLPNIKFDVYRTTHRHKDSQGHHGSCSCLEEVRHSLIEIALLHQQRDVACWLLNRNDIIVPASTFEIVYRNDYFEIFKTLYDRTYADLLWDLSGDPTKLRYLQYFLTRKDIAVNVQASDGATALHHAVQARNIGAVRELLKYPKINPFLKLKGIVKNIFIFWAYVSGDFTPRELAEELGYEEIEEILKEFEDSLDD